MEGFDEKGVRYGCSVWDTGVVTVEEVEEVEKVQKGVLGGQKVEV
jgi:hypothetical protein